MLLGNETLRCRGKFCDCSDHFQHSKDRLLSSAKEQKKIHPLKFTESTDVIWWGLLLATLMEKLQTPQWQLSFHGDGRFPPVANLHPIPILLFLCPFAKRINTTSTIRGMKKCCLLLPAETHRFHSTSCCPKENLALLPEH